jgi:transposase
MERRRFTREFKLEVVRLIRDRGAVKLSESARRKPPPAQGRMKPEQLEIARLKREVSKLAHPRCIIAANETQPL